MYVSKYIDFLSEMCTSLITLYRLWGCHLYLTYENDFAELSFPIIRESFFQPTIYGVEDFTVPNAMK